MRETIPGTIAHADLCVTETLIAIKPVGVPMRAAKCALAAKWFHEEAMRRTGWRRVRFYWRIARAILFGDVVYRGEK